MDAIGAAIVYFCLISTYNSQSRKAEYSAIIGQRQVLYDDSISIDSVITWVVTSFHPTIK